MSGPGAAHSASCIVPAWGKCWDVSGGEEQWGAHRWEIGGGWVVVVGQDDVMSIPSARGKPNRALLPDGECWAAGWAEMMRRWEQV